MYPLTITSTLLLALSAGTFATTNTSTSNTSSGTANMTITWYQFDNCDQNRPTEGLAGFTTGLDYGVDTIPVTINGTNGTMLSYKLSRPTTLDEQLDLSGPTKGMGDLNGIQAACTLFHETSSPDSNGNVLKENQCYGLLLGPASCLRLFKKS